MEYLKKLKEFLQITELEAQNYPQESDMNNLLSALQGYIESTIEEIENETNPKPKNLIFGHFSTKNRIDVYEGMELDFGFEGFSRFKYKVGNPNFRDLLDVYLRAFDYKGSQYFYQNINPVTNEITFYFAFLTDRDYIEKEISLYIGAKKYTFGKLEVNKFYPRYDDRPPLELIQPNNKGFALSYNLFGATDYIAKLLEITEIGGTLADLRFLRPDHPDTELLVSHFKGLKWYSIMTQNARYNLQPDNTYKELKLK